MRRFTWAALVAAALAVPAIASADKSQSTLVNPVATSAGSPVDLGTKTVSSGVWTNGVSKGKTQGDDKCKVQIQLLKINLPDSDQTPGTGDEVICISDAKVNVNGVALNTTAVFRGEIKKGNVKIKADLFAEGIGCVPTKTGGPAIANYESRTACYLPDAAYPNPPLGFASDPTQGIYPVGFAPTHPATGIIATDGIFFKP